MRRPLSVIIGPPEIRGHEPVRMFGLDQVGTVHAAPLRSNDQLS